MISKNVNIKRISDKGRYQINIYIRLILAVIVYMYGDDTLDMRKAFPNELCCKPYTCTCTCVNAIT